MKLSQVVGHNTQIATTETEHNSSAKTTPEPTPPSAASTAAAATIAEKSNVEHVTNNEAKNGDATEASTTAQPAATTTATTTTTTATAIATMTDERSNSNNHPSSSSNIKNNNNNNSDNSNNNNSGSSSNIDEIPRPDSERIIAEAAKILLKNRLNGANAAAVVTASLLAANFQTPIAPSVGANSKEKTTTTTRGTIFQPPSAAYLGAGLPVVGAARSSTSNGVSSSSSTAVAATSHSFSAAPQPHKKAMAASACTQPPVAHMGIGSVKSNIGVLDYTVNASSTSCSGSNKSLNSRNVDNNNSSSGSKKYPSSSDANSDPRGNTISPISGNVENSGVSSNNSGGRLHIFKDGKLVLELACASGGDKSGWVSVPRKLFHTPSATSSTVTPTLAAATAYPKNESSTSLSFSDDNSSIQSSPWQRDHCWKQATPCRGISKALSLWYQRPKGATLTRKAILAAQRKRRRPTRDQHTVVEIFEYAPKPSRHRLMENNTKTDAVNHTSLELCVTSPKTEKMDSEKSGDLSAEDDGCSTSSTATLTGGRDCIDAAVADRKTPTPNSPPSDNTTEKVNESTESVVKVKVEKTDENAAGVDVEKMSTSDDEDGICASMYVSVSMDESEQKNMKLNGQSKSKEENKTADKISTKKQLATKRGEEKRLKKQKTRAKLNTIIQKLIDTMPTRMAQASTRSSHSSGVGTGSNTNNNSQSHKVSPPTSSATSRLVDYPQQHVSPRKRILREFEKVSLEDNVASSAVAHTAKRSRAKSNASLSSAGASSYSAKSSPSRAQNCVAANSASSPSTPTATNGTPRSTSAKTESSISSSPTPTRLNSSYSIHSLLSGSSSSSSSANALSKRPNDPAIISNFNYQLQQQPPQHYTDPSYLRSMLASPKSPEGSINLGGKSPSNSASKKRSPPYASPLRDFHARSPTVAHNHSSGEYGRRSPHLGAHENATGSYKMRFAAEHSGNPAHSPSSHLPQHSGFYSPFMLSAMPNTSVSPNSSAAQCTTRSPRHHAATNATRSSPTAFSSASATATTSSFSSSSSANIPNVANSIGSGGGGGSGVGMQRELSSPRIMSSSPRDNAPRTVPKKTASIRRQFASPTASTTSSSCPSPSERTNIEETTAASGNNNNSTQHSNMSAVQHQSQQQQQHQQQQQGRKTPFASTSAAHSLQRTSPSGALGSAVPSPFHYYMYPGPPNGSASPHALGAVGNGAYIPQMAPSPFYAPYINAIAAIQNNPVFMQHAYAQHMLPPHHLAPASPAARLPPPFAGFGYAAVMANAMQQQQQHQMLGHPALQQGAGHGLPMSVSPLPMANTPTGRRLSPKTIDNSAAERQAAGARSTGTTPTSMASGTIYASSIKDEHSSDVPLNLSKH